MNKLDSINDKLESTLEKAVDPDNMKTIKKLANDRLKNFNKIYSDEDAKRYITSFIEEVIPRDMRIDLTKVVDVPLTDAAVSIYFFQRGHGKSVLLSTIIVVCFICTNFMQLTRSFTNYVIVGQPMKYNTVDLMRDIKNYSEPKSKLALAWMIISSIFVLGQSIVKTLLSVLLVQPLIMNSWFSGFTVFNKILASIMSLSSSSNSNVIDDVSQCLGDSGSHGAVKLMNTLLGEDPSGFIKNNSNIKKYMDKFLGISMWIGIYIPLFFFVIRLGKVLYKIVTTNVDLSSIKTGLDDDPNKEKYDSKELAMFECWYNNTGMYSNFCG